MSPEDEVKNSKQLTPESLEENAKIDKNNSGFLAIIDTIENSGDDKALYSQSKIAMMDVADEIMDFVFSNDDIQDADKIGNSSKLSKAQSVDVDFVDPEQILNKAISFFKESSVAIEKSDNSIDLNINLAELRSSDKSLPVINDVFLGIEEMTVSYSKMVLDPETGKPEIEKRKLNRVLLENGQYAFADEFGIFEISDVEADLINVNILKDKLLTFDTKNPEEAINALKNRIRVDSLRAAEQNKKVLIEELDVAVKENEEKTIKEYEQKVKAYSNNQPYESYNSGHNSNSRSNLSGYSDYSKSNHSGFKSGNNKEVSGYTDSGKKIKFVQRENGEKISGQEEKLNDGSTYYSLKIAGRDVCLNLSDGLTPENPNLDLGFYFHGAPPAGYGFSDLRDSFVDSNGSVAFGGYTAEKNKGVCAIFRWNQLIMNSSNPESTFAEFIKELDSQISNKVGFKVNTKVSFLAGHSYGGNALNKLARFAQEGLYYLDAVGQYSEFTEAIDNTIRRNNTGLKTTFSLVYGGTKGGDQNVLKILKSHEYFKEKQDNFVIGTNGRIDGYVDDIFTFVRFNSDFSNIDFQGSKKKYNHKEAKYYITHLLQKRGYEEVNKDENFDFAELSESGYEGRKEINLQNGSRVMKYPVLDEAALLKSMNENDPWVEFWCPYRERSYNLRKSAYEAYMRMRERAQADGYDIRVFSGYRTLSQQKGIYSNSDKSGKWVATPSDHTDEHGHLTKGSFHHTGGTLDICLIDKKTGRILTPVSSKQGCKGDYCDRLEYYANSSGFQRYNIEPWHFEMRVDDRYFDLLARSGINVKNYQKYLYPRLAKIPSNAHIVKLDKEGNVIA